MAKFYLRLIAATLALYITSVAGAFAQNACIDNGKLLFIENFDSYDDGLNPSSAAYSTKPLPIGMTSFEYTLASTPPIGIVEKGCYSLVKTGDSYNIKLSFIDDDHTSPTDATKGRFLVINGKESSSLVYMKRLDNLDEKAKLYFSFWINGDNGKTIVTAFSSSTNEVLMSYSTANKTIPTSAKGWVSLGFDLTVPSNENSIRFEITSSPASVDDNCIAFDDIAIYSCKE